MRFKKAFKKLEVLQRILRQYLSPWAWKFVAEFSRDYAYEPHGDSPVVLLDLKKTEADADAGRDVALLVYYFKLNGYTVVIAPNHYFLASFRNKRYKRALLAGERSFSVASKKTLLPKVDIRVSDHASTLQVEAEKIIDLNYEARQPTADDEVAMPYRMHPDNLLNGNYRNIPQARKKDRLWHLFFAGNCDPKKYNKPEVSQDHGVLTRVALIEQIKTYYGPDQCHIIEPDTPTSAPIRGFATIDFDKTPVENTQWLQTLAKSHFFIAAPGVHMPMSHNVVEAMAVGTIPLLEYSDYFDPPLEHGVNCIAFSGAEGLQAALAECDALTPEELSEMHENVADYYDRYIHHKVAVKRLVEDPRKQFTLMWNSHKTRIS